MSNLLKKTKNAILLSNCKTFNSINEFCVNNKEFCVNNKEKICKKMLEISGNQYFGSDYCNNYEQVLVKNLSNILYLDNLTEFCKNHKQFCTNNKDKICKQIIYIYGYKTNASFNNCDIYHELLKFSRTIGARDSVSSASGNKSIKMSESLLELCKKDATNELRHFLIFNNFSIKLKPLNALSEMSLNNINEEQSTTEM